jgi:hypothetical protein
MESCPGLTLMADFDPTERVVFYNMKNKIKKAAKHIQRDI